MSLIEVMAPAGSFDALSAALRAGANSIYFGVGKLNMRAGATANFNVEDLPKVARFCRKAKVKSYLTLNTILYDNEIAEIRLVCDAAKAAGISAIIATDFAVINYARSIKMPIHISVQAGVCNLEAVRFYATYADAVVLARELSLKQIKNIITGIEQEKIVGPSGNLIKIEIFAHGALCVAVSGKCGMSLATYNSSSVRGECFQNCRRRYKVTDYESGDELVIDNEFVMSPKDLCTIGVLDQIIASGISILKLEGRGRSADYVSTVVSCYREAAEACADGSFSQEKITEWLERLEQVYNRGFWHGGYYLGENLNEWSASGHSRASKRKIHVGRVTHYFPKLKVAELSVEAHDVKIGDELLITGKTTGAVPFKVEEIRIEGQKQEVATKPVLASMAVPVKVRNNDQVYLLVERKFGE
ncbi:MAG: U32 family peptidase [Victivallaceae bacterium]|nr:U32 family peptidase [Victivallaceae bacterium]